MNPIQEQEVRFFLRIGKDKCLKLRDSIYSDNLPKRTLDEMGINVQSKAGHLSVSWNGVYDQPVYYRVEILPADGDLTNAYFISRFQGSDSKGLEIKPTTAGEVNRLQEMKADQLPNPPFSPFVRAWN